MCSTQDRSVRDVRIRIVWEREREGRRLTTLFCPPLIKIRVFNWSKLILTFHFILFVIFSLRLFFYFIFFIFFILFFCFYSFILTLRLFGLTALLLRDYYLSTLRKCPYGLPQSAKLSQTRLIQHLAHGDKQCENTPCLFRHSTRDITFFLVVDDFGVSYPSTSSPLFGSSMKSPYNPSAKPTLACEYSSTTNEQQSPYLCPSTFKKVATIQAQLSPT